jgi:hypothetical protein
MIGAQTSNGRRKSLPSNATWLACSAPFVGLRSGMGTYQLYCFGESGNCYKAALMLELCKADWQPIFVDYFNGQTRSPEYRGQVNEMGEAPVLVHGTRKISQSGVILDYLAEQTRRLRLRTTTSAVKLCAGCCSTTTSSRAT